MKYMSASVLIPSLFWLLGLLCALMPFQAYEAESFALAVIFVVLAVSAQGLLNPPFVIPRGVIAGIAAAFWGLAFISVLFSEAPYVSFIYFCFFSVFPLSFLWVAAQPDERVLMFSAAGAFVIVFVLCLISYAQYFIFTDYLYNGAIRWPFADPNALAAFYSLGLFTTAGIMFGTTNRFWSNIGLIAAILFLCAIIITFSRGALVSAIIGFLLLAWLLPTHVRRHKRCFGALAAMSLVFSVVLSCVSFGPGGPPSHMITGSFADGFISVRPDIWASTWAIITDHFWTGTGIGTFFMYYPEYRTESQTAGFMAHSDPLQFWAELGVFAPLLFYGFIAVCGFMTLVVLRTLPLDDPQRVKVATPFCALAALVAHAHFAFPLNVLSILMVAGLVAGFWYRQLFVLPRGKVLPAAYFSLFLVFVTLIFLALQGGEILVNRAQRKAFAGDMDGFIQDINKAGALSMNTNARALMLASTVPLGILEENSADMGEYDMRKMAAQGLHLLDQAEDLNPRLSPIYYYRARYGLAVPTEPEISVEDMLQKSLRIDPSHLAARMMLADFYTKQGRGPQGLDILIEGLKWQTVSPLEAEYYERMATLALQDGNMQVHEIALRKLKMLRQSKR